MDFQRDRRKIITYPPEKLKTFKVDLFEWIDNLNFTIKPEECLPNAVEYVEIAKEMFLKAGWHGDGEIELMWIPPFMLLDLKMPEWTNGVTIWHVKQQEDGISWLLLPDYVKLPNQFE
jgi:hypothetical protein